VCICQHHGSRPCWHESYDSRDKNQYISLLIVQNIWSSMVSGSIPQRWMQESEFCGSSRATSTHDIKIPKYSVPVVQWR
jgi:hypothetical protein